MEFDIVAFEKLAKVLAGMQKESRKKHIDLLRGAYPDYGRSLVAQDQRNPVLAGVSRGARTGLAGGVLAALIARLMTDNPKLVGSAGLGGAAIGGIPGYISGKREAESEHTKNLALRRLGINNPAERMLMGINPSLIQQLIKKDVYL